ncbi:TetR/AcrR family transcriptional regulator [Ktedonosporobacter rubrisoli]|uniref:TetR/AcrR family transcriptional regulator n=1 Tax=Ktedonosporobacter rubrisoli TaxID=2509675 RepID=A0A4V0YY39_KTERU|nr:TetR/AcrR family transcriptional regulator [Ktedonosporobacter rubrisoli]QBD74881.1 TetR/AcrR family transcriptional regulator [Ktedonosporobacter rubrisoli]
MYPKFASLEQEKKERIINAAIKEFARSGYDRASTNEIIKEANIAKGSLFSYFNNKKELYLFLLDYVSEFIDKIYSEVDCDETDIFEIYREIALVKFKMYRKFPQIFDFLKAIAKENAPEVKSELEKRKKEYLVDRGTEKICRNIDETKFRSDIDVQKAIDIINWTALSFAEQQSNKINSYADFDVELLREWERYLDLLRRCFYKAEE